VIPPERLEVVMLSLEGPDRYSQAGGLGVRARELCRALASCGVRTTLVFAGDPALPAEEVDQGVRLVRWGQHISRRHPAGVYQGEEEIVADLEEHLPGWLAEHVVGPASGEGRTVALLAEEWQTAAAVLAVSDRLHTLGLRHRCAVLWNANNTFGFDRIDWRRLGYVAAVTTVSRYMRQVMLGWGVRALVIPNGIPEAALAPVDPAAARLVARAAGTPCLAFKIGRFSPDKRWHQAISAVAALRARGIPARLLLRGGIEPFGGDVLAHARHLGLPVADWFEPIAGPADIATALADSAGAPLVHLRSFLPDSVLPAIYAGSTAVLANSGHEPFGLVGLEAMAAGGVAVVGPTGEEYARPYVNAVVIETDDGAEVAGALRGLVERPDLARRLRRAAQRDAAEFTWARVVEGLLERLRYVCEHQGVAIPG
jgi:glycosyltransferase involved in cell wall biosynthesis